MKANSVLNGRSRGSVILGLVFVSLLFGKVQAKESDPQQPANAGKYQAIYAGKDKVDAFHIILIVNTETGKLEKRIFYDEANDKQDVFNYAAKEVSTVTRREEKIYPTAQ